MPSFHVLIATIGRASLQTLLDSLLPQLTSIDHVTIVFDGVSAIPMNFGGSVCKIHVYEEPVKLGFWGHAIRNKYANRLERTDFVMHGDDDDTYLPNSFNRLRMACINTKTLYVAQMSTPGGILPAPQFKFITHVKFSNIGTPCGIIPFDYNSRSEWKPIHGGDYLFYKGLEKILPVKFLNIVIYNVPSWDIKTDT